MNQTDITEHELKALKVMIQFYNLHADEYTSFKANVNENSTTTQNSLQRINSELSIIQDSVEIPDLVDASILKVLVTASKFTHQSYHQFLKESGIDQLNTFKAMGIVSDELEAILATMGVLHHSVTVQEGAKLFSKLAPLDDLSNPKHKQLFKYVYCHDADGLKVTNATFNEAYSLFVEFKDIVIPTITETLQELGK